MSFTATDPQNHEGETNIWLTPPSLVQALGDFDLDPCAHKGHVLAKKHLYELGLETEWTGRVWLNPPYGRSIGTWLNKLAEHGNGIALVFVRTDTFWFQELQWDAINLLAGRIKFLRPNGTANTNAGTPSMLIAFGKENIACLENLSGTIVIRKNNATN